MNHNSNNYFIIFIKQPINPSFRPILRRFSHICDSCQESRARLDFKLDGFQVAGEALNNSFALVLESLQNQGSNNTSIQWTSFAN
jgi:hypothetical protein